MATDLLTAQFEKDALRKKYKNYFVPVARVLIGDSQEDLAKKYPVQIENIRVSLNLKDAASATFQVAGVYDLESRSLNSSVRAALSLGTVVKIEMGYESDTETVFQGFIYEVSVQFEDFPSIQITAMDVKRLMLDNYRENYVWNEKKYSEIFKKIMKDYEKLKLKPKTDDTETELGKPIIQRGSDLDMVRQLCRLSNRRFLVCGGKAYFTKKDKKEAITTLLWGQELLSFGQSESYVDTVIEVWGNLKGSAEKIVEKRTVTSQGSMKHVRQKGTTSVITLTDVGSADELKIRADNEEEAVKERVRSGRGSCVGTPVLIPGRYVKIRGIESEVDGKYYLESVSHSFGADGFTTDFTIGGKK